jgi:hypothetical protein
MHLQRVLLLMPVLLGISAILLAMAGVLSWVTPAMEMPDPSPDREIIAWKVRMDLNSLACFGMCVLLILAGGPARPAGRLARGVLFVLAGVPLVTALLFVARYSTTVIELLGWRMTVEAELFWPGFAVWLTLASALVLMISTFVVGWIDPQPSAKGQ